MIKNKDLIKVEAFCELAEPYFVSFFNGKYTLVEFCAGNGLGGKIFLNIGNVKEVRLVDIRKTRGLEQTLVEIGCKGQIFLQGINHYQFPNEGDYAIIAIHACGSLTDLVLEKAIAFRVPVAIMPCCYNPRMKKYNLQEPPNPRLLLYSRSEEYYDTVRLQFLRENKYQVIFKKIDEKITPMNNVLIGLPY